MEVSIEEKREISPLGGKLVNAILSNLQKAPFKVTLEETTLYHMGNWEYQHSIEVFFRRDSDTTDFLHLQDYCQGGKGPIEKERQTLREAIGSLHENYSRTLFEENKFRFSEPAEKRYSHLYTCSFTVENN